MENNYKSSQYYIENIEHASWRRGTQDARKFWFHWGNPFDRYIRKSIKSENSEIRKRARGNVKTSLKKVNIDSSEEQIDEILTEVFDYENHIIPWYEFEEEVKVVPDRNFSVDICFPNLMLIFEINGNQHYDLKTMELLPYYQERHNIISSLGWQVVEIPYNQSYNEDFRLRVCRQLDAKLTSNQYIWEFESPHSYLETLKEIQEKKLKNSLRKEELRK